MIGIIGAGNMGRAIALHVNQKLVISDENPARLRFKKGANIRVTRDNVDLVKRSKVIILAVKPQHIIGVLKETRDHIKDKLVISIAAGIEIVSIEKILKKARVIRVMPNMPLLVGKGISAITCGKFTGKKDMDIARKIFLNMGEVIEIKEVFMDAVTAVSGSGPAYYFLFTDTLEKAGQSCGLKKSIARRLAIDTFIGAAESAARSPHISMQDFIKKVASKGGTTEAALEVFKEKHLDLLVKQAVKAAVNRSLLLRRGK